MARDIKTILSQLGLDENSTYDELLNTLKSNSTITDNEINNIINTSVKPLPNAIKNKPDYVKQKMYNPIVDENLGFANVFNKRIALLSTLIEYMRTYSDNTYVDLNSPQEINGKKKFNGGIELNDKDLETTLTELQNLINSNKQQINAINTILKSDDVNLDTLQELVNALKNNVASINDIFTLLSTKVDETEVMGIVNENSTEVDTLNIGTSDSYDETSDNEIPTTKAVKKMIGSGGSSGGGKVYKHHLMIGGIEVDIYTSYATPITSYSQLSNVFGEYEWFACGFYDEGNTEGEYVGVACLSFIDDCASFYSPNDYDFTFDVDFTLSTARIYDNVKEL